MTLYECCSSCPTEGCPDDCTIEHLIPCRHCASGARPLAKISLHRRALAVFGPRAQLLALAEELAEAAAACARLANDKGSARDVVEELVDVESVIESLRDHLADATVWERMRATKRAKLARALEEMQIRTRSIP